MPTLEASPFAQERKPDLNIETSVPALVAFLLDQPPKVLLDQPPKVINETLGRIPSEQRHEINKQMPVQNWVLSREQMNAARNKRDRKFASNTPWSKVEEKGQPRFKINFNKVANIESQFVHGSRLSGVLGMKGRTDSGGEPVYHIGLAESQGAMPDVEASIHSQISPENPSRKFYNPETKRLESENPYPELGNNFSKPQERVARDTVEGDKGVDIYRHPVFPGYNMDKQEVNDEQNAWWENLDNFAKEIVDTWLEEKEIPGIITLPYAAGAYVGQFIKKYLSEAGVDLSQIRFVGHLHSAGMPKLENSINQIINHSHLEGENIISAIEQTVTAPHTNFGVRILAERSGWNDGLVVVNAKNEKNLLTSSFYSQPIIGIPALNPDNVIDQPPGIQSHLFYNRETTKEESRNPAIEAIYPEKQQLLQDMIATLQNPEKPLLYTAARFEQAANQDNKGWYDVLNMYLTNEKVHTQANLLLFADFMDTDKFPNMDEHGNVSLAKRMRDLVSHHQDIFNRNVILVPGPNQIELATYNQVLAEMDIDTVYIGGSLKEPWGLMAAESANSGNPVLLSSNYNAKQAFEELDAVNTYTPGNSQELAEAIEKTLNDEGLLDRQAKVAQASTWDGIAPKMLEIYKNASTSKSSGEILIDASNPRDVFFANSLLAAYLVIQKAKEIFPNDEDQKQLRKLLYERYGVSYTGGVMNPNKNRINKLFEKSISVSVDKKEFYRGQNFGENQAD